MDERPDDPRAYAGDLAGDLRAWLEWAALTGAVELPRSDEAALARVPLASPPQSAAPAPPPKTPSASPPPKTPSARTVTPRAASSARPIPPPPRTPVSEGEAGLLQVREELGDCQRCRLGSERRHLVFGVGNPNADLVLVGEGPGRQEDLTGEPFVGRAGQLLTRMLAAIGLRREDVYICNVIKCRPPQNRDPLPDEIAACSPFLHRQLRAIEPKVILTLGRFAGSTVGGVESTLGELRKRESNWNGVPIVATYHPSYLLRTPHMKRAAWEDLLAVRRILRS